MQSFWQSLCSLRVLVVHVMKGYNVDLELLSILCCTAGVTSARTARVLVLMVIPGQLIFIGLIYAIEPRSESVDITPLFAVVYVTAAIIQVMICC